MEEHYQKMVKDTENRVLKALQIQVMDKNNTRYGGFPDGSGIIHAKIAIYKVTPMIACYCNPDTVYYHHALVRDRIHLGLDYIRSVQHENGLFDYVTCNFNSAPDTAFCVKKLLPVYEYLRVKKDKKDIPEEEEKILTRVEEIVRKGCRGLLEGGFHTPNHRWAIASVLMKGSVLFEDEDMKKAAFTYLKEGIDANEDGEFAEKSAGNYNRINNDAMIMLTEATGDPSYEAHAVRNLTMMLTYFEPDDSIFTANSTRFDKDLLIYPKDYYLEYLRMGIKYKRDDFLGMANRIFRIVEEKRITSPDFLIFFMRYPSLRTYAYTGVYQPSDFEKYYRWSHIVRARKGLYTYTVQGGKSNFFYIHNGSIKMEMKVGGSFCEHRAFISEQMEQERDGVYHLSQVMRGWYYLPFEEPQDTTDWWQMDNKKRKKKMGPDMHIDVWVSEAENGVDVRVKTSGVEGAPWRIELAFTGADFLTTEGAEMPLDGSETIVVKKGYMELSNAVDALIVGPCFGEHHFMEGKEDSEAKSAGAATIYLTDYTAFDHTIEIRNKRSIYLEKLDV